MVHKRQLPDSRNPLISPEHTPSLDILIERRRLGQTNLAVKPGQVGIANATKSENLGIFDYAHLRVPLPKDLDGSEIFSLSKSQKHPESYFLMRRSSDGCISATGMFKAAFPWASLEEEAAERDHHKSLPGTRPEEVAGNVWVPPETALDIADEYGMRPWVVALLDPEPIEKVGRDKDKAEIATPPRFIVPNKASLLQPTSLRTRTRELRSASPTKTPRRVASPRKRATRSKAKNDPKSESAAMINHTNHTTAPSLENGTQTEPSESVATESVAGRESVDGDAARGEIMGTTGQNDSEAAKPTATDISEQHPDLSAPEKIEDMLATAREMVEEAKKIDGDSASGLKRKAEEVVGELDEVQVEDMQRAKRTRLSIDMIAKKERIQKRALVGLSATLALGALGAYFL